MKIFGDTNPACFKTYHKEPGLIFGHNDVLKGNKGTGYRFCASALFGESEEFPEVEPTLYLHIPTSIWSAFTGKLREYCLPWRWKTVYLDREDGKQPERILICTKVYKSLSDELPNRLEKLVNQSWFATNLINSSDDYQGIFGKEFIAIQEENSEKSQVDHPLGNWCGRHFAPNTRFCHIFRKRGLLSSIKFLILKLFSHDWQEVTFRVNNLSEKVLIQNEDRTILLQRRNYIN